MTVGARLRLLREARGLSQEALARAAGITHKAYWMIENNRTKDPGLLKAAALAKALGVPIEALVDDEAFQKALEGFGKHLVINNIP